MITCEKFPFVKSYVFLLKKTAVSFLIRLTMFFSFPAHFLKICKDCPACSIPGVANTTWKIVHNSCTSQPFHFLKKHATWKRNTYHRPRVIGIGAIKGLDVFKFKHVSLHKCFSDLLVGPRYEQLVVVIGFLCQPSGEVDWGFQVHSLPVW